MATTGAKHIVLYDDGCPMCTFQMRGLTWLDWLNVIRLMPLSDSGAAALAGGLTREDLLEAIHCVTPAGRIYRGARAIRFLGMRIPLLIPLSLVMWVPGVIWIAEMVYGVVSRHRQLLSRVLGCREACAIMPVREREADLNLSAEPQDS
jgi:predicted DCC family thiol-disulfide oxidoreductase YuxK